ncbi:Nif11-like leader peptide family natural product precursor [Cyanobium sp. T1B-Tous]|jgi:hypothetical protein|uniref:hypothetical protein n=1 Tax=Cyanobium sp. T1B-Tous TaxID=2823721 RepID=UPI0020CCD020|nr:hypothetical protein [Cyanobium sp. T1B-Tous]MCP9805990.1 Nif11-like leader peptide family natural product precursor [Cyanobium sp. T1B-Tous]
MTTCNVPSTAVPAATAVTAATEALHQLKELAQRDPLFAAALMATGSTEEAVLVAQRHGITLSPEALWRHRGTLMTGGLPTWRG